MKYKILLLMAFAMFMCSGCGYVSKFAVFAEYATVNEGGEGRENALEYYKETIKNYINEELNILFIEIEKVKEGELEETKLTKEEITRWKMLYFKHKFDCPELLERMNEAVESLENLENEGLLKTKE